MPVFIPSNSKTLNSAFTLRPVFVSPCAFYKLGLYCKVVTLSGQGYSQCTIISNLYFTEQRYLKMRKKLLLTLVFLCMAGSIGCSQKKAEPYVVNTFNKASGELDEKSNVNDAFAIMVTHYEMSDGTWKTDNYTYQYRLEISGRMNGAAKDSTYVFLSNTEDITFEQAWKASGLSSDMDDYFDEEEAKLVAIK